MAIVTIRIRYDEYFRHQVEDGTANPLVVMDVRADGERVHHGDSFISRTIAELLEAVDGIFADETQIIELTGGPSYLVFESQDGETVLVTGCGSLEAAQNPDTRLSSDTTAVVNKQTWIEELVRVAEEHRTRIIQLNPELGDDMFVHRIRDGIGNAEQYLDVHEKK